MVHLPESCRVRTARAALRAVRRAPMSILLPLLLTATACDRPPQPPPSRHAASPTAIAASRADTTAFTAASTCAAVAGQWPVGSSVRVRRFDPRADTIETRALPPGAVACAVEAYAATGFPVGSRYWGGFAADPLRPGWLNVPSEDADGPDGFARTVRRGAVRCSIDVLFDGDDDSDSTFVPAPWEREVTVCWEGGVTPTEITPRSPAPAPPLPH